MPVRVFVVFMAVNIWLMSGPRLRAKYVSSLGGHGENDVGAAGSNVNSGLLRRDGWAMRPAIRCIDRTGAGYEFMVSNHHVNLTPQENSLIAESDPEALARMDSAQLKELQSRLRQAREKNFSLLRRQGAARVEAEGGRGAAQPANEKRGEKVEAFDEALARVSQYLDGE